jgi:hypothetical protein
VGELEDVCGCSGGDAEAAIDLERGRQLVELAERVREADKSGRTQSVEWSGSAE